MSLLKLLYYPDKRLRKVAKPVKYINKNTHILINNMFDTMYLKSGIGLAATQININYQIVVIDISSKKNNRIVLINPKILSRKGKTGINEGCLSIPNYRAFVLRSLEIKVQALDIKGNLFMINAKHLLSICIQHEIDHLIGKLFIDYL